MFPSSLRKRSRRWEPPSPGGQLWDETLSLTRVPGLNARLCPACQKRSGSSQKAARMKAGHCRQKDEAAERGPPRGQRETDAGPRPSRRGPGPHAAPAPSRALSLLRSKNMTLPRVSPTRCLSSHPVSRASRRAPGGVEARWLREPHPVSPPYSRGKHTHTQSHIHGHTQSHAHALARTAPAARSRGGRARGGPRAVLPEERAWLPRCTRAEFGKSCLAPRRKEPGPQRPRPRAAERGLGPEALAGPGLPRTRGGGGDLRRLSRQRPGSERPLQQGARGRDCLGLLSDDLERGRASARAALPLCTVSAQRAWTHRGAPSLLPPRDGVCPHRSAPEPLTGVQPRGSAKAETPKSHRISRRFQERGGGGGEKGELPLRPTGRGLSDQPGEKWQRGVRRSRHEKKDPLGEKPFWSPVLLLSVCLNFVVRTLDFRCCAISAIPQSDSVA